MDLSLDASIVEIDEKLAARRTGYPTKGPEAAAVLAESLDIFTAGGLLHHYPRRYIDRSRSARISQLPIGAPVTIIGHVEHVSQRKAQRPPRRGMSIVTIKVSDGSGVMPFTFFNQPWIVKTYREGVEVAISGIVTLHRGALQLARPEFEVLTDEHEKVHTGRITPVHPASEGITPRTIRELIHRALERLPEIPDPLPPDIVKAEHLGSYDRAIRDIHFPVDEMALDAAVERLKFDELFTLELGVAFRKHRAQSEEKGVTHRANGELTDRLMATLPFEPTQAQRHAMHDIGAAMARPTPMNVLLQGDVGAGKTVVALHAALVAIGSGHQAAIMAPTEVLAGQHYRSIAALMRGVGAVPYLDLVASTPKQPLDPGQVSLLDTETPRDPADEATVTFALLTAAVTGKDRARILEGIAEGNVDLVVGTHALVQEGVSFADLSLAVVDEQHRFGLHQRMALKGKGGEPDVLIMTATPIPRTLALTYYGDLDVVVLDEMPKGRQRIETRVARTEMERASAYDLVRVEARAGRQAFVVCSAIDENSRTQVKAAEGEAERLATQIFPDLRVDLLHGRMRPKVKEDVMDRFRAGECDLLISTTVIEVGVDVPNATVMLVENAERFGLAQLHQLRGRIGRGAHASYCVLFDGSEKDNKEARARLAAMVRTTDGFELADEDLRLRGEGTLFDTKQSGMPDLKLARLAEDMELVKRARTRAFSLIDADPRLEAHPELFEQLRQRFERSIDWLFRS